MHSRCELVIDRATVKITCTNNNLIGSGVIYYNDNLRENVYILTAAHCLFKDSDSFKNLYDYVNISVIGGDGAYHCIKCDVSKAFISTENDVAIVIVNKKEIAGPIPVAKVINHSITASSYIVKGFPFATQGKEIACIQPSWLQSMAGSNDFQLRMEDDYTETYIQGFSGSGIFCVTNNNIYLLGIFVRYRAEERGKVVYCKYLNTINELLKTNYQKSLSFSFIGNDGLDFDYFKNQVSSAIANLGPRFNQKINFRLPIAQHFSALAKDGDFEAAFLHNCEDWIKSTSSFRYDKSDVVADIDSKLSYLKREIRSWASLIEWSIDTHIETECLISLLSELNDQIELKQAELYTHEKRTDNPNGSYSISYIYNKELYDLLKLKNANSLLINNLTDVDVKLSNNPQLIIKGAAGCGKSHLLGDIASERIKNNLPTILLLGQLFKESQNISQNIISQLNLKCTIDTLYENLNEIGQQVGSRVLILIDAINEGAGKALWQNEIKGFLNDLRKFPFIGLAITIRDSYYKLIITEDIQKSDAIPPIIHEGFRGNEYEALRLFCKHYQLTLPSFPILTPEFSNPLFLHLTCQGLANEGMRDFPKGFNGITTVFKRYINYLSERLANKREEYKTYPKIVAEVIDVYVEYCIEHNYSQLISFNIARDLFLNKFPSLRLLLVDLIEETFFIKSQSSIYSEDKDEDYIFVSYERIGDYLIGNKILNQYDSFDALTEVFVENSPWDPTSRSFDWNKYRLLEIFAVLVPEKFNRELIEAYSWLFKETGFRIDDEQHRLLSDTLDSLKWREIQTINDTIIVEYLNKNDFPINDYLYALCELSPINNHPFNSDRLTKLMLSFSMAERDSFWQQHMLNYRDKNDNGIAYPLRALIDWAWEPKNAENADNETARLVAQTLIWLLSSTNPVLRDQATKALVCLLEEKIPVLIQVLEKFKSVDDLYVLERLYAVAYGCALRTTDVDGRNELAQLVYVQAFKDQNPPQHILLRDYARNVIEYAVHEGYVLNGDIKLVRPPYNSKTPDVFPNDEEIEKYTIDLNAPEYKQRHGHANNQISFSVLTWDFGRYTVNSAIGNFDVVNFSLEIQYKEFKKRLPRKLQEKLKTFHEIYEILNSEDKQKELKRILGGAKMESLNEGFKAHFEVLLSEIKRGISNEDVPFFEASIIEYYDSLISRTKGYRGGLNSHPFKLWIVKRAFELGYNSEWHGEYDDLVNRWADYRHSEKIERIGKKYQWIAFFEILSMLADNHKIVERYGDRKSHIYEGPWEIMTRNIDPVMIDRTKFDMDEDNLNPPDWRFDVEYPHWSVFIHDWINNKKDLIDPKDLILRIDESGMEWFSLHTFKVWREPHKLGQDKYCDSREIWYMIFPYIIKKKDKDRFLSWAKEQNFSGRWMPENESHTTDLINREHYWAPISKQYLKQESDWEYIRDTKFRVMIPTVYAVGEMSEDKSGSHFYYRMPWRPIFNGLKLHYSKNDGDFTDGEGNLIVTTGPNNEITLVKKGALLKYLNDSELDIVWIVLGEKQARANSLIKDSYSINTVNGVLFLSDEKNIEGGITSLIKWA